MAEVRIPPSEQSPADDATPAGQQREKSSGTERLLEAARDEAEHFMRLAEETPDGREQQRDAAEGNRQHQEGLRQAAEAARVASEEGRLEAEDARRAAVDSLRAVAESLASTLERMTAIEGMRRSLRELRETTKRDAP